LFIGDTNEEIDQISIRTVDQGDDQSGEWIVQHHTHVTASTFGETIKQKAAYASLVEKLLYNNKGHAVWP